jgi:RNA polymerase sigma-70 factor, ECF subfamily
MPDHEQDLVARAKRGDRDAFLKLIQPYHERVHATAVRLLGNADEAAEVTQEAILRTFWHIQSFHGRAHFYTWLYRIALNLCYRRLSDTHAKIRRRSFSLDQLSENDKGSPLEAALPDHRPSPRAGVQRQEEIQLVRRALSGLSPQDFQILILREFDELSYEEIADRLKLSKGTVMSRLHRARGALAKRLRELGVS